MPLNDLTIVNKNGQLVTDSRQVAQMIGKDHAHLIRDIDTYISYLSQNPKLDSADFFIESSYEAGTGKPYKCYLITKKGCDMVANKMTGEKGVIFTATYVTKFDEMEKRLKQPASIEDLIIMQAESVKELKATVNQIQGKQEVLNHRINSLDCTNIEGTPQQRLNGMVKKYAYQHGIVYGKAWDDFKKAFNTAYHTNVEEKKNYYMGKQRIKNLTMPAYLTRAGLAEDALRVADKMINEVVS